MRPGQTMIPGSTGRHSGLGLLGNAPPGFQGNTNNPGALLNMSSNLLGNQQGCGIHGNGDVSQGATMVTSFQNQLCFPQGNHGNHGQITKCYQDKISEQKLVPGNRQYTQQYNGSISQKSAILHVDGANMSGSSHGNNQHGNFMAYPCNKTENGSDYNSQSNQHLAHGNHFNASLAHMKTHNLTGNHGNQGSLQQQKQNGFHQNNNNRRVCPSNSTQMLLNSFSQLQRGGGTVLATPLGGATSDMIPPNSIKNGGGLLPTPQVPPAIQPADTGSHHHSNQQNDKHYHSKQQNGHPYHANPYHSSQYLSHVRDHSRDAQPRRRYDSQGSHGSRDSQGSSLDNNRRNAVIARNHNSFHGNDSRRSSAESQSLEHDCQRVFSPDQSDTSLLCDRIHHGQSDHLLQFDHSHNQSQESLQYDPAIPTDDEDLCRKQDVTPRSKRSRSPLGVLPSGDRNRDQINLQTKKMAGIGDDSCFGQQNEFFCHACNIKCHSLQEFDDHMNSAPHTQRMSDIYNLQMKQAQKHKPNNDTRDFCKTCDRYFHGSFQIHKKTDEHKRKDRLTRKGCLLCKTGSFPRYPEYVCHIDSQDHKQRKEQLAKNLAARGETSDHPGMKQEDHHPGKATPENHHPGKATPENHHPGKATPENHHPGKTTPENHQPGKTTPENHHPGKTTPENHHPGKTSPESHHQRKSTQNLLDQVDCDRYSGKSGPNVVKPETKEATVIPMGTVRDEEHMKSHDPATPVGVDYVVPTTGYFCELCHKFFTTEDLAKRVHCSTEMHHHNYQKAVHEHQRETEVGARASTPNIMSAITNDDRNGTNKSSIVKKVSKGTFGTANKSRGGLSSAGIVPAGARPNTSVISLANTRQALPVSGKNESMKTQRSSIVKATAGVVKATAGSVKVTAGLRLNTRFAAVTRNSPKVVSTKARISRSGTQLGSIRAALRMGQKSSISENTGPGSARARLNSKFITPDLRKLKCTTTNPGQKISSAPCKSAKSTAGAGRTPNIELAGSEANSRLRPFSMVPQAKQSKPTGRRVELKTAGNVRRIPPASVQCGRSAKMARSCRVSDASDSAHLQSEQDHSVMTKSKASDAVIKKTGGDGESFEIYDNLAMDINDCDEDMMESPTACSNVVSESAELNSDGDDTSGANLNEDLNIHEDKSARKGDLDMSETPMVSDRNSATDVDTNNEEVLTVVRVQADNILENGQDLITDVTNQHVDGNHESAEYQDVVIKQENVRNASSPMDDHQVEHQITYDNNNQMDKSLAEKASHNLHDEKSMKRREFKTSDKSITAEMGYRTRRKKSAI